MAPSPITVPLGPAVANLTGVRAGDRNLITMTISQDGTPVDLTDHPLSAQARLSPSDPTPSVTADIEVLDAPAGSIAIRWPGDQVYDVLIAANADVWVGVWDLQIETVGEDPLTVCAGKFTAELDVTRP